MSKVTDALMKAEEARRTATVKLRVVMSEPTPAQQNLWKEVQRLEEAFSRRTDGPVTARPAVLPVDGNGKTTSPAPEPGVAQEWRTHRKIWEQALQRVESGLAAAEQQAARNASERTKLQAQLAAKETLMKELDRERLSLEQQLVETLNAAEAIEAAQALWCRRLETLRGCQDLVRESQVAEQQLETNAKLVASLLESQQRLADELVNARQQSEGWRQRIEVLQAQVRKALASAGIVQNTEANAPPVSYPNGHGG